MTTLYPLITVFIHRRHHQGIYNKVSVRRVGPRLRSLDRSFGHRPLDQLSQRAIERWLESLHGLATNSRATYLSSVRQFTAWLTLEGKIRVDPCAGIPPLRRARSVPRAQPATAIRAVLDACETDRDRAIIWLEVGLGMRRAEVAGARWEHYNEHDGVLLVRGKGSRERELPVIPEVAAALAAIRTSSTGPIIRSLRHPWRGVQPETVGKRTSELMLAAGVKQAPYDGVSGHALRHTAASDVLDECGDLRVVMAMLGHSSLAVTSIYQRHADIAQMREAMGGRTYTEV